MGRASEHAGCAVRLVAAAGVRACRLRRWSAVGGRLVGDVFVSRPAWGYGHGPARSGPVGFVSGPIGRRKRVRARFFSERSAARGMTVTPVLPLRSVACRMGGVTPLKKMTIVKKHTASFKRHQWNRHKKLNQGEPTWRRPKGIDSRVRRRFKGTLAMVNIGYGNNKKTRHVLPNGFKKFPVSNVRDLEMLLMQNRIYAAEIAHNVSARKVCPTSHTSHSHVLPRRTVLLRVLLAWPAEQGSRSGGRADRRSALCHRAVHRSPCIARRAPPSSPAEFWQ